ncbi:MAG: methyltransferase [Deltaproteobacteria bacterium]|jgi:protein-S-isoprenylcysteine O-methyltransferase Ste14
MRYFLPAYFVVCLSLVFVVRVVLVRRRTGADPFVERWRDDLRGYVGRMLVVVVALVALDVVAVGAGARLVPIEVLKLPAVEAAGAALLVAALAWIVLAQVHMGDSWRIGVDPDAAKTPLVTAGLFGRSRNPVFLGMRVAMLGLVLAAPNVLSLTAAILAEVLIQVQVRVEEVYLDGVHGERYRSYRRRVRRWI